LLVVSGVISSNASAVTARRDQCNECFIRAVRVAARPRWATPQCAF
jgi:hypothetical protein